MFIALQSLVTMHCNLLTDIRVATETDHSGIEINGPKLKRYLAQGYKIESLLPLLKDLPPVGLTYVQDIERKDPRNRPHSWKNAKYSVLWRRNWVVRWCSY